MPFAFYALIIISFFIISMDDYASFGILSGTCTGLSANQFNLRYSMSKDKLFIINFIIRSFNSIRSFDLSIHSFIASAA